MTIRYRKVEELKKKKEPNESVKLKSTTCGNRWKKKNH